MNNDQYKTIKDQYPDALRVWYDRMFDLDKKRLIETLLTQSDATSFMSLLRQIDVEIQESRQGEGEVA